MRVVVSSLFVSCLLVAGCSSDAEPPAASADTGSADTGSTIADTGTAPEDTGAPITDSGIADTKAETSGSMCTSARDTALGPIETVSTGVVTILSETAGVRTLFIDASAGGTAASKTNPWIYVTLADGKRADLNDKVALTSDAWDLAIKRPILRNNSGDSGPGGGGAVRLTDKTFDAVTKAEATAAVLKSETWFDASCTLATDATGAIKTSFDGWYDYDGATMHLTPAAGVWIVRGAKGALFKLEIKDYYANPDGTTGMAGGRYVVRVQAVE